MDELEHLDITPAMKQRLSWDICDCAEINDMWGELGLTRPSNDVAEAAHAESHYRMSQAEPFLLMGDIYITLASEIISCVMKHHWEKNGDKLPDEAADFMVMQNREVLRAGVYPILAHMLETGVIQFGPTALSQESIVRL
jgi:hypothetical protein